MGENVDEADLAVIRPRQVQERKGISPAGLRWLVFFENVSILTKNSYSRTASWEIIEKPV